MPEVANEKLRQPLELPAAVDGPGLPYAELDVTSNFSFLRGASHPDELVFRAAELGYEAIAITDLNSLAGVVRAHDAARQVAQQGGRAPKLIIGSQLSLDDGPDLLVWATDRASYGRLCRLLTLGKRRVAKGECALKLADFIEHSQGMLAAIVPVAQAPRLCEEHRRDACATNSGLKPALQTVFPPYEILRHALHDRLSLAVSCCYGDDDRGHLERMDRLSRVAGIPLLATNHVHYHHPQRRALQDVLTCIRHGCTITEAGFKLFPNGERYLKSPAQMHRLFADYPHAIQRGLEIAGQCQFSLDQLRYEYPSELTPPGQSPIEYLTELTWRGAAQRYPQGVPDKVRQQIEHELVLIQQLKFEAYFLTVYDLVTFARGRGILCQGRGSAANSAVCYCIGVTSVDPARIDVLFERFVSAARGEPPDIDVDFEHERREEVIQYIYEKYGRERAGMTAEVISYRGRSAVRDVGKAMGLSLDLVDHMARKLDWWHRGTLQDNHIRELGLNPTDPTIRQVVDLTTELLGFPRHLSQHVGGMIMTRGPLCELVPIENAAMENRTVIEWDKDDIDALGILKVDVLALGMLTCISKALKLINEQNRLTAEDGEDAKVNISPKLELHTIPPEDPAVYNMIGQADTIGVFQIESRAQMSMLPRLKPRCFYDLVIEVAIVRPGPIQGNMVHPYLRRRNGEEPVVYPSEALRQVLQKTLGVPLFQEQAMRVAMVGAGFSAEEADRLRRAMAAWRKNGTIETFHQKIVDGMLKNGYTQEFAEQCFLQIRGFGEYGFPESHAASFALLVYVSAWLKKYHPAAFAAALLNSQPMGFYAPAQIVRDAKEHGVKVHPVDVNFSQWDCTLEERHEGTEARRHEEREEGDKLLAIEAATVDTRHVILGNAEYGQDQHLSRSDRLAAGNGTGQADLSQDSQHASERTIRPDQSDAASGSVNRLQHCRRLCASEQNRLSALPENGARLSGRVGNTSRAVYAVAHGESRPSVHGPPNGDRSCAARSNPQLGALSSLTASSSCLRACVPSCLPLRLGFRLLKGLRQSSVQRIVDARQQFGQFSSIEQFHGVTALPRSVMKQLAQADAFASLHLSRRQALWQVMALDDQQLPLFPSPPSCLRASVPSCLPPMPLGQEVMIDYRTAGLSLKKHPVALVREQLDELGIIPANQLLETKHGQWVQVAGLVLIRQRPGTAAGVVFVTLEDETGIANLIIRPHIYEKYRLAARHAALLHAQGYVQRQDKVIHVMVWKLTDRSELLVDCQFKSRDFH